MPGDDFRERCEPSPVRYTGKNTQAVTQRLESHASSSGRRALM